jgi:hypothetical protein
MITALPIPPAAPLAERPARGEIMRKIATTSLALALALLGLAAAAGDGLAQEQQSFKTLISRGYDVKAVTFARGESTENREVVLVTLQKERSVAVCYFAAANWINLSNATLEDPKRCDVR